MLNTNISQLREVSLTEVVPDFFIDVVSTVHQDNIRLGAYYSIVGPDGISAKVTCIDIDEERGVFIGDFGEIFNVPFIEAALNKFELIRLITLVSGTSIMEFTYAAFIMQRGIQAGYITRSNRGCVRFTEKGLISSNNYFLHN